MRIYLTLPVFDDTTFEVDALKLDTLYVEWVNRICRIHDISSSMFVPSLYLLDVDSIRAWLLQKLNWEQIAPILKPHIPELNDAFECSFYNDYDSIRLDIIL